MFNFLTNKHFHEFTKAFTWLCAGAGLLMVLYFFAVSYGGLELHPNYKKTVELCWGGLVTCAALLRTKSWSTRAQDLGLAAIMVMLVLS